MDTTQFWETRAQRFAGEGKGLRAICSYAMPSFYNWSIDITQRWAMQAVIKSIPANAKVLDYGCGIGRWSRAMAARGARVVGIDFSATMIHEARRRSATMSLEGTCEFRQMDVTQVAHDGLFDVAIGVTVLQHVLDDAILEKTLRLLAGCVRRGGRVILFEVAPTRDDTRCDTGTFRARPLTTYLRMLEAAGLQVRTIHGVDPMPFKRWILPRYGTWPRPLALCALALASLVGLPLDLLLGRLLKRWSWHKIVIADVAEKSI